MSLRDQHRADCCPLSGVRVLGGIWRAQRVPSSEGLYQCVPWMILHALGTLHVLWAVLSRRIAQTKTLNSLKRVSNYGGSYNQNLLETSIKGAGL